MREAQGNGFTVTETRVSPHGNVSLQVVVPDGRKVTVHLKRGQDTPEGIAEAAMTALDGPVRPGRR